MDGSSRQETVRHGGDEEEIGLLAASWATRMQPEAVTTLAMNAEKSVPQDLCGKRPVSPR